MIFCIRSMDHCTFFNAWISPSDSQILSPVLMLGFSRLARPSLTHAEHLKFKLNHLDHQWSCHCSHRCSVHHHHHCLQLGYYDLHDHNTISDCRSIQSHTCTYIEDNTLLALPVVFLVLLLDPVDLFDPTVCIITVCTHVIWCMPTEYYATISFHYL